MVCFVFDFLSKNSIKWILKGGAAVLTSALFSINSHSINIYVFAYINNLHSYIPNHWMTHCGWKRLHFLNVFVLYARRPYVIIHLVLLWYENQTTLNFLPRLEWVEQSKGAHSPDSILAQFLIHCFPDSSHSPQQWQIINISSLFSTFYQRQSTSA